MNSVKTENERIYVQFGCGLSAPDEWINFDVSPQLRLEQTPVIGQILKVRGKRIFPSNVIYGDVVKGLPIVNGAAAGIYCSHVLEHLDRNSIVIALRNTRHLLKPGGLFRLVVPDLVWRAKLFLQEHDSEQFEAADRFMRSVHLGQEFETQGILNRLRSSFGNSHHRWMYDYKLLERLLFDAGFESVRRCHLGDSEDPMFKSVEEESRFFDKGNEELAIEARMAGHS